MLVVGAGAREVATSPRSSGPAVGQWPGSGPSTACGAASACAHAASVAWELQRRRARCAACSVAAQVSQPSADQNVSRAARHVAEVLPVQSLLAAEAAWKLAKEVTENVEGAQRAKGAVRSSKAASLQPGTPVCS